VRTLDLSEAADLLKVHENRVMEWAGSGVIPGAKLGRAWVFIDDDLFAFVRRQITEQSATRALPRGRSRAGSRSGAACEDRGAPLSLKSLASPA